MKNIFTIYVLAAGVLVSAQDAGKAGELLKNEATKTEMQSRKNDVPFQSDSRSSQSQSAERTQRFPNGSPGSGNSGFRSSQPRYHWNYNFGYSEVFVRIPEMGFYSVEVGNQMMSNDTGKFRFFDLNSGTIPISIYKNGFLVYKTRLNIRNNTRLILDFFSDYGLYLLDSYPVQGQTYGFNQWDDVWNNPYNNGNMPYGNPGGNVMAPAVFDQFLVRYKNSSFDGDKINFVKSALRNTMFTAQQIAVLMREISFDKNRLETGKLLYPNCADRQNFFVVYDTFDFDFSRNDLMRWVGNR